MSSKTTSNKTGLKSGTSLEELLSEIATLERKIAIAQQSRAGHPPLMRKMPLDGADGTRRGAPMPVEEIVRRQSMNSAQSCPGDA